MPPAVAPPEREADVLRHAVDRLSEALPDGWRAAIGDLPPDRAADAVLSLETPDGQELRYALDVKRALTTRDVPHALTRLRSVAATVDAQGVALVARYLSPNTRQRIAEENAAYLDATGNIRISSTRPPLFVSLSGADRDPWRGPGRPRGSLKGGPAARVVRGLVDFRPPYTVPELIERTATSTGACYRVVKFLEQEDLLDREERGPIVRVDWRRILERWSEDYGFERADVVRSYLAPRGIETAIERLREGTSQPYVVTGSVAAGFYASYAPPRLLTLYTEQPEDLAEELGLRGVDTGANVLVGANTDDFPFLRATDHEGLAVAAPSQVAVDLLNAPGRGPAEAEALIEWMEAHEQEWRLG